ncbi:MAG: hypothetical protein AAGH17_01940 [Pseudomonadota bacterium]
MRRFLVFLVLLMLAACGGGGGGSIGGIDSRLTRLDGYTAQQLRVLGNPAQGTPGLPQAAMGDLPPSGHVDFAGFATLRVENPGVQRVLYGNATLQIGFGADASSGTLDGFFGNDAAGDLVDYAGSVALAGGPMGQGGALGYTGSLTAPDAALTLDGQVDVMLLGAPLSAVAASDLEATVGFNGADQDATLVIVAER